MAEPNYTIPDWPLKRLRFFDRQFLQSKDFIDDQAFHIAMRYRDNKLLRLSGVLEGMGLTQVDAWHVRVGAGSAINAMGRVLLLGSDSAPIDLSQLTGTQHIFAVFNETATDDSSKTAEGEGDVGKSRFTQTPSFVTTSNLLSPPAGGVILASVSLTASGIDVSKTQDLRQASGLQLPIVGSTATARFQTVASRLIAAAPDGVQLGYLAPGASEATAIMSVSQTGTSVAGSLSATALLSANGGLTVPAGQTVNILSTLNASGGLSVAGTLTASGLLQANGGLTVPTGQTVNIQSPLTANSSLTVAGTLTASGLLQANGGLTVPAGQAVSIHCPLSANSSLTVAGALTASSLLQANGGLTVSHGQTLNANGPLVAKAGASISGALLTASSGVTVSGGQLSATAGASVSGGPLVASAGATVTGSVLTANAGATISGAVLTANNGIVLPANQAFSYGLFNWSDRSGTAYLNTSKGDVLSVAETGQVNIQSSSGSSEVSLSINGQMQIRSGFNDQKTGIWLNHYYYYSSSKQGYRDAALFGMLDENHVSIEGFTNPNATLHGVKFSLDTDNGDLTITGGAYKPGGGAWSSTSDERLKTNIAPLKNALDRLLQLEGVTFEWREPEKFGNLKGTQIGLIAQKVEPVFPEWIGEDQQGHKTLSIRGFEALTIESLRQLWMELRALRGEPALLKPEAPALPQRKGEHLLVAGTQPGRRGRVRRTVAGRTVVASYDYVDEQGTLLFQVLRYSPKAFRCQRPDGSGGWIRNMNGVRLVLYHMPAVVMARNILLLEGEKDAATAEQLGLPDSTWATTTCAGGLAWRTEYGEYLRNKNVFIVPDSDRAGHWHLGRVVSDLDGKVAQLSWLKLPSDCKDLSEWANQGKTHDDFSALIRAAQPIGTHSLPVP